MSNDDQIQEKHIAEFRRCVHALNRLMAKIRQDCPTARYYLANDTLNLLSGDPHEGQYQTAQYDRVVADEQLVGSTGGDW